MIECELKARVRDPEALRAQLSELARAEPSTYRDVYYDQHDRSLAREGREVRIRTVETATMRSSMLTYKEPAVDRASGSKPEHETVLADPGVVDTAFRALGAVELVAFTKQCVNYRFTARGRDMLATMVTVPEIDGTFLELETMADIDEVDPAIADVRATLAELGINEGDLTAAQYSDAVMRARKQGRAVIHPPSTA